MNEDVQTDTMWTVRNYMGIAGRQKITNDKIFQISGDKRPTTSESEFNYGNYLNISDCSARELDGVTALCGSHLNREQVLFNFKVCGKFIQVLLDA